MVKVAKSSVYKQKCCYIFERNQNRYVKTTLQFYQKIGSNFSSEWAAVVTSENLEESLVVLRGKNTFLEHESSHDESRSQHRTQTKVLDCAETPFACACRDRLPVGISRSVYRRTTEKFRRNISKSTNALFYRK